MRRIFQLDMEPQSTTSLYLQKVVDWVKIHKPNLNAEIDGNNKISFECLDDDEYRSIQGFFGYLVMKFAKEDNIQP